MSKKIKMETNATQTKLPTLSTSATSLETGNRVVREEVTKSKQPYISTLSPTHSKQQKQTSGTISPVNRKQLTEYGQKKRSPECPRGKQQKKGYEGGRGPPRMRKVSTEEKLEREQRRIERQQRQFEKKQLQQQQQQPQDYYSNNNGSQQQQQQQFQQEQQQQQQQQQQQFQQQFQQQQQQQQQPQRLNNTTALNVVT